MNKEDSNIQFLIEWQCPACGAGKNSQGIDFTSCRAVALHIAGKMRRGDFNHKRWAAGAVDKNIDPHDFETINKLADVLYSTVLEVNKKRCEEADEKFRRLVEQKLPANPPSVQAYIYISELERRLHQFVQSRLKQEFGEDETEWWMRGIPKNIRVRCVTTREESASREEPYSFTNLIDLGTIIAKNWVVFETLFRPFKKHLKSKNQMEATICQVNDIRNRVFHLTSPTRMEVSDKDLSFLRWFHELVLKICDNP